jgi:hypothetical protein
MPGGRDIRMNVLIGIIGSLIATLGWEGLRWLTGALEGSSDIEDLLDALCRTRPDRVQRVGDTFFVTLEYTPGTSIAESCNVRAHIRIHAVSMWRGTEAVFLNRTYTRDEVMALLLAHRLALLDLAQRGPSQGYA